MQGSCSLFNRKSKQHHMGAAPSNLTPGGETRIGSGAHTHSSGGWPCLTLLAMVRHLTRSPDGGVDAYPLSPMQQGCCFIP